MCGQWLRLGLWIEREIWTNVMLYVNNIELSSYIKGCDFMKWQLSDWRQYDIAGGKLSVVEHKSANSTCEVDRLLRDNVFSCNSYTRPDINVVLLPSNPKGKIEGVVCETSRTRACSSVVSSWCCIRMHNPVVSLVDLKSSLHFVHSVKKFSLYFSKASIGGRVG